MFAMLLKKSKNLAQNEHLYVQLSCQSKLVWLQGNIKTLLVFLVGKEGTSSNIQYGAFEGTSSNIQYGTFEGTSSNIQYGTFEGTAHVHNIVALYFAII